MEHSLIRQMRPAHQILHHLTLLGIKVYLSLTRQWITSYSHTVIFHF